ncbi:MAG: hypothetical protein HYV39_00705 [Candidatus Levybacteria bacterium]|nr:hypothetical protein [Candidatus Levybacteria bacterium]
MTQEQLPGSSPLDQFDQKTRNLTDFSEYLRILITEGVPAMETTIHNQPPEVIDSQYRLVFGLATSRVLENREKAGLPNNAEFIAATFQEPGIRELIGEFIVEPNTRRRILDGIVVGLEATKVTPPINPQWLAEPDQ